MFIYKVCVTNFQASTYRLFEIPLIHVGVELFTRPFLPPPFSPRPLGRVWEPNYGVICVYVYLFQMNLIVHWPSNQGDTYTLKGPGDNANSALAVWTLVTVCRGSVGFFQL